MSEHESINKKVLTAAALPAAACVTSLLASGPEFMAAFSEPTLSGVGLRLLSLGLLAAGGVVVARHLAVSRTDAVLGAMEVCQANVMLADNDMNIVYMNKPAHEMMRRNEAKLREALPGFRADDLVGKNVDIFHRNPGHQRRLVTGLHDVYKTEINVAGLTFGLTATPLFDAKRNRTGTVIEWYDRTQETIKRKRDEKIAAENTRTTAALKICETNIMLADADLNIIFLNDSVQRMMKDVEKEIRAELPSFNADNLLGQNVDVFHKNPMHQRTMLAALRDVHRTKIKVGKLTFSLIATPVWNDDGSRLGTVIEWKNLTQELEREEREHRTYEAALRVKQALDNVTNNTMIADRDGVIVYMNAAVRQMLKHAESDIRKALPHFDAERLLGVSFDSFHRNPAHQRNLLGSLQGTHRAEISLGGRVFSLTANPIFNDARERIGSVVEWRDRTDQVDVEQQLANLISEANSGNLAIRLDVTGKEGFYLALAQSLNQLISLSDDVIGEMVRVMDGLSQGRLTDRVTYEHRGVFTKLRDDTNATIERLHETITTIIDSAVAVSNGADEIAQGNADLSQRTEQQASSLEETASSMEEITSAVRQSSQNAVEANLFATEARDRATRGGEVVSRAVAAMSAISASSKKISDIIGVIDEIAFQTNLLALNAAVEAARAGEQGRGFAVVASEVRSLAQRSAGAAKEIKELILDSVGKVQDGTRLVNESGETLKEIVASVQKVSGIVQEITAAASDQSGGIEQVNIAVSQMDEMTQQNAALVEEASAAGESLSEQAGQLMQLMAFFDLGRGAVNLHSGVKTAKKPLVHKPEQQQSVPAKHTAPAKPVAQAARPAPKTSRTPSKPSRPAAPNFDVDDEDQWEEF